VRLLDESLPHLFLLLRVRHGRRVVLIFPCVLALEQILGMVLPEGHRLLLLRGIGFYILFIGFDVLVELCFLVVDAGVFRAQGLEGGVDLVVEVFVE
jgi:hypothetical protein